MKKPHISTVHYMSKTASLNYEGEVQTLMVELVIAVISVALTLYGYFTDWDLLIPIFIIPAVLCSIGFCYSLFLFISSHVHGRGGKGDESSD